MPQVNFPVFDSAGGLRELPGPGCLGMFSNSIHPQAKENIDAFNAFIHKADQPSFFISDERWEMLRNGRNHAGQWLQKGYEVYGFVFCLALKRWDFPEGKKPEKETREKDPRDNDPRQKERGKLFGYAYFRIRTILKKTGTDLEGISEFDAFVEEKNIAYVDIAEALKDNSELNEDQVKFVTDHPADDALREIINKEVIKKGDDANLQNTFFQGVDTSYDSGSREEPKGRKIHGVFSNEGGIFGKDRIEKVREHKGARISIARRIRPYDEEKDKEEGLPDLSRREIYYHFKINPQYETDMPCPMPRVC